MQKGMSPVRKMIDVKSAATSNSASEIPAWVTAYKQGIDQKFWDQSIFIEKQGIEMEKTKQQSDDSKQQIKRLEETFRQTRTSRSGN